MMIPKPKRNDRIGQIRKRQRKKADKEWQAAVPDEGQCANCGMFAPLAGHHLIGRKNQSTRHSEENRMNVCMQCHTMIHSCSASVLIQHFPDSPLVPQWEETRTQKKLPYLPVSFPVHD